MSDSTYPRPTSLEQVTAADLANLSPGHGLDLTRIGDFLDYGGQYKVFAYGERQVIKFPLSRAETDYRISQWGHHTPDWDAKYRQMTRDRERATEIIAEKALPLPLLANPVYYGAVLVQDRVQVVSSGFWAGLNPVTAQRYVRQLVALNATLWSYGVHEKAQNFTLNNGLDAQGEMVIFDYGEFTTDYEKAIEKVRAGSLEKSYSYRCLPPTLQSYYSSLIAKELRVENLQDMWNERTVAVPNAPV